jgi:hypothetical protein
MNCFIGSVAIFILLFVVDTLAQEPAQKVKLVNPITTSYLKKNVSKKSPKLFLTPQIEKQLKRKLKTDPLVLNYYNYLKVEADSILKTPLLKRELEGFRLLFVSRDMLERMTVLCMVYRIDKSPEILERINKEVITVCSFDDWNPQHFLDIAEMSLAVSLAVDWVGKWLPNETVQLAKSSLIEKAIKPSFNESGTRMFWINSTNNWNAVCHGGMIAASLVVADDEPELAAKTISRALNKLPGSLSEYAPDGIYPEGPTYWGYGTSYSVVASNILETALGTDFGISHSPGFMESVAFLLNVTAPSGDFFNFADSGDKKGGSQSVLTTWFAAKMGDGLYLDKSFFKNPVNAGRFGGVALIWLSQFEETKTSLLPTNWHGNGANPVAVFRGTDNNPNNFFLAAKGGKANLSHGNMDAGTFVFDLNGVRWVVDPGNQRYYLLNKIGFNLSGHCQDCPRWTLLTKKNQGHSTITINNERFDVNGQAKIIDFKEGNQPEVTIEMTDLYFGNIDSFQRRFIKETDKSIVISDSFEINDSTKTITWGLMTQAEVQPTENGAVLFQDGKQLKLSILEPEGLSISILSLDPPPMEIDKTMENLKRIEIEIPAWTIKNKKGKITVQLSAD